MLTPSYEYDVYQHCPDQPYPPVAVRWVAWENIQDGLTLKYFSMRQALIRLCKWGRGTYRIGDQEWPIEPGTVFWSEPGVHTELKPDPSSPLVSYLVMLEGEEVNPIMGRSLLTPVGAVQVGDAAAIERLMQEILTEASHRSRNTPEICLHLVRSLLMRVETSIAESNNQSLASKTFHRCREYIDANFVDIHVLSQVAKACDLTVPHLCVLFNKFQKVSPYEYITRLKMNKADRLLMGPKIPVKDMAKMVGYANWRLFTKNFKTLYGYSPREYRKRLTHPEQDQGESQS